MSAVRYIDTYELARSGSAVAGVVSLRDFGRLCAGLPEQADQSVEWSVRADKNTGGEVFLWVSVKTAVLLECQRCLEAFAQPLDVSTRLQVVAEADLDDGGSHDPDGNGVAVERIAASHRLDILELIEDEIILGLPYVPRHDACPSESASPADSESDEKRPSPFSVLGKLKKPTL
ncbi:MAG TPA: YceD family protein [Burkholderiaceae bacterium]|nr:YceD family protein [Burkholderiaceae bacterium]